MKKYFILLLILGLGAGAFWYYSKTTLSKVETPLKIMPETTRPDPSNATFILEDGAITLKNGIGRSTSLPGSSVVTETALTDTLTYGDINNDGKNDTVAILLQSGGGSGMFVYAVAYVSGNVGYKGSNGVFLGDRISPKTISISKSGLITVNYLDRGPDEPMAAEPTISISKELVYSNGTLEER